MISAGERGARERKEGKRKEEKKRKNREMKERKRERKRESERERTSERESREREREQKEQKEGAEGAGKESYLMPHTKYLRKNLVRFGEGLCLYKDFSADLFSLKGFTCVLNGFSTGEQVKTCRRPKS